MHNLDFDYEEPVEKRFDDLCQDLCIDSSIREEAWDKYKDVWANYSIDGDQIQWLVCSLYECCRRCLSDGISEHVDNAYVSLSRLLSAAKMSMVQFFHRIRKWADMTDMMDDMRDRIELLERQFSVSSVIFRNFGRSFGVLFSDTEYETSQMRPTGSDLFRFTWLLFIKSRASFPAVTDDLVNSYHLLACCLDWILGAVMLSRRRDLINMDQNGLPRDFLTSVAQSKTWCPPHDEPTCMLRQICEDNDVNYVECKTVKEHFFRPFILRLIEKDLIKLHPSVLGSLLEPENFEITIQNLNNNYEEYIIGTGNFDERIYLNPNASEEIGSIGESTVQSDFHLPVGLTPSARRYMLEVSNSGFGGFTETTRRGNANAGAISRLNGGVNFSNPEARSQNLNQLQILLNGRSKEPSESLVDLINAHCSVSPLSTIRERLEDLGGQFQRAYAGLKSTACSNSGATIKSTAANSLAISAAQQRLQLCYPLYYMALENILVDEIRRIDKRLATTTPLSSLNNTNNSNQTRSRPYLSTLLAQDTFHRALFICCMEIVMLSCDPPNHHFPWILEALSLDSIQFFKVAEVLIRNIDFPREIIKYMNQVVEYILDSYAWRSNSSLWSILKATGRAPSIEEVIPPEKLDQGSNDCYSRTSAALTPGRKILTSNIISAKSIKLSPSSFAKQPRLTGSITSKIPTSQKNIEFSTNQTSIHRLLSTGIEDESAQAAAQLLASGVTDSTSLDSSLLGTPDDVGINQDNSNLDVKPMTEQLVDDYIVNASITVTTATAVSSTVASVPWSSSSNNTINYFPTRHDSIAIFFRQTYQVASLRLRDLCERLNLTRELMAKIWTCIEQVIVHETELLRDRCLDQIIMCCIYGICKLVLYRPLTFVDIVQVYRMQPQSYRDIYRRVLINRVSYGRGNTEERGDLSRFYNVIFLQQMKDFIKKAAAVRSTHNETDSNNRTGHGLGSDSLSTDDNSLLNQWTLHPLLSPMPIQINTLASTNAAAAVNLGLDATTTSGDMIQARRLASNRNIFISPVKQQVSLSPKKVIFTVGRSTGKDLQDVNLMISSAERRASMANLTMGLKRPAAAAVVGGGGGSVDNPSTFTVTTGTSSSRTVTLVGPSGFTTKRIDFNM
ncbi:Retinoblastoma-like protein 1 [Schistosoma japonicum]|nr:Retinoblastoma-like protein 1 [Schistosoma japonicum]